MDDETFFKIIILIVIAAIIGYITLLIYLKNVTGSNHVYWALLILGLPFMLPKKQPNYTRVGYAR